MQLHPDDLAHRSESTARWGALCLDTVLTNASLISVANTTYEDSYGLLQSAQGLMEGCGPEAHYFAFHSGRGMDIVIPKGSSTAYWWTSAGFSPISEWTAEDARVLFEDAALRDASGTIEAQGIEVSYDAILRALAVAPGRKELLTFARRCVSSGKFSVAGKIIDDCLARDPNNLDACELDAKITIALVSQGQWPIEKLKHAEARLEGVIARAPSRLSARMAYGDAARFGGQQQKAIERYTEALRLDPSCDVAHYNIGAILLEHDPAQALAHFTRGRALAPDDADYVVGEGRAYAALGQLDQARECVRVAMQQAPNHPRLAELRRRLGI